MPQWLDNAIFYEVYPQSFRDANADGVGDLAGILEKLDYIQALGCNAIWMNPCFLSPFGDAGYDVADYYTVAPRYGTNEDLRRLFAAVHQRGMHILLDLVPGHTSVEHRWFQESKKPGRNAYTDRYIWTDSVWEHTVTLDCLRGISDRDGCCAVNFFSNQPALNYGYFQPAKSWQQAMDAPGPRATLEAMKDVMRFWLQMGCDGFRVDMAGSLVKEDVEGQGTIRLWQNVRAFLDREFPEAALVSEWGEPDKSLRGGFHMDFLLQFGPSHYNDLFRCPEPFFSSRGQGDVSAFVETYLESRAKAGPDGLICIPSGNHDSRRLAPGLQGDELKIVFAFLLSMPGAPFIYYGDEIGMRYVEGLTSVEGGYERTGSRTPMQWDRGVNAGFSAAPKEQLYIPQDESEGRPTVQDQLAAPNSLLHEVRKLTALRQAHPALQSRGEIEFLHAAPHSYPLAYVRTGGKEQILVVLNPADRETAFETDLKPREALYQLGQAALCRDGHLTVAPCSAGFYLL